MKKISIFTAIFMLMACSTPTPQRTVTENTIYSKFPKLNIHVSSEFEYLGVETKNEFGPNQPQVKREIHQFICADKFVYVEFNILGQDNWFRYPFRFTDKDQFFIIDREMILKRDVPYAIEYDKESACLIKHVVRDFGKGGFIYLYYVEQAPFSDDFPFSPDAWGSYEQLAPEQKERVKDFQINYKTNITFTK